jgi:hypothetical protein
MEKTIDFNDLKEVDCCLSTNNDLDARFAIVLVQRYLKDANYLRCDYNSLYTKDKVKKYVDKTVLIIGSCFEESVLEELISACTRVIIYTYQDSHLKHLVKLSNMYPWDRFMYKFVKCLSYISEFYNLLSIQDELPWYMEAIKRIKTNNIMVPDYKDINYGLLPFIKNELNDELGVPQLETLKNSKEKVEIYGKITKKRDELLRNIYLNKCVIGKFTIEEKSYRCILLECNILSDIPYVSSTLLSPNSIVILFRYDISNHKWICHCRIHETCKLNLLEEMLKIDKNAKGNSKCVIITLDNLKSYFRS